MYVLLTPVFINGLFYNHLFWDILVLFGTTFA